MVIYYARRVAARALARACRPGGKPCAPQRALQRADFFLRALTARSLRAAPRDCSADKRQQGDGTEGARERGVALPPPRRLFQARGGPEWNSVSARARATDLIDR